MKIETGFVQKNTVSQEGVGILKASHPIIAIFDPLLAVIVHWFIADELETELDSVSDITGDSGHGYSRNHLEMINHFSSNMLDGSVRSLFESLSNPFEMLFL